MSKNETPDVALPFSDVWRQMEFEIERLRAHNEKILDGMRDTIRERDILSGENYDLRAENERLKKQSADSYNAAIDVAAMVAKTWGPPNWSWSESSIIIKDTCDEIALAIRGLKNCKR